MSSTSLGKLIGVILAELDSAMERIATPTDVFNRQVGNANLMPPEELLSLQVSDLELDLPAHLQVKTDPLSSKQAMRLMVTLPSTLETPPVGRMGRIRITIKPQQFPPPEQ